MAEKMRVSVVIPTYCRAALVCQAIESVLGQDIDGCEIIVIDDGSTDDTRDKLQRFGSKIRYIFQENKGLGNARNFGFSTARGEFIALLDDDDWWMPGKLSLQIQVMERLPEIAAVFSNFSIYRDEGDVTRRGLKTWYENPMNWEAFMDRKVLAQNLNLESALVRPDTALHIGSLYEPSLERYFVLPSTALVRRNMIPDDLVFPEHDPLCGDWEFFARLSKHAPVCFIDCDTAFNRSHRSEHRITQARAITQIEHRLDFLERVYVADHAFYAKHRSDVDRVWKERLSRLCQLQLLDNNVEGARRTAIKFKSLGGSVTASQRLTLAASAIPGASAMMRLARSIKRLL